jgi:hypothetical protein
MAQTQQELDIIAERKRGEEEGNVPEGRSSFDINRFRPTRPGQQPMVTMDMVKAAGFDNLRDYLNDQKGLKRREKPSPKSVTTQIVTPPKPAAPAPAPKEEAPKSRARSFLDQGRGVQLYKDVDKEAVLNAGLGLASVFPAVAGAKMAYTAARPAIGAAARYFSKKDSPAASVADDIKEPAFNPEKMVDRSRSEHTFNPDKMTGRDRPDPNFKKGGSVKKMVSSGKVSSASSRGDGIAQRGKTKGRIV